MGEKMFVAHFINEILEIMSYAILVTSNQSKFWFITLQLTTVC